MKFFAVFFCLLLAGCFLPDIRINRKVSKSEVIGTWLLDPKCSAIAETNAIDRYIPDSSKPHRIILNPDGTCSFQSVIGYDPGKYQYQILTGTWKLETSKDNPSGSYLALELGKAGMRTTHTDYDFREENGNLILWCHWGDPGSWQFLEYRLSSPPAQSP
ncbi:MAG: hypothetical protein V4733_08115 [Verrucomicrobiota bacterium]